MLTAVYKNVTLLVFFRRQGFLLVPPNEGGERGDPDAVGRGIPSHGGILEPQRDPRAEKGSQSRRGIPEPRRDPRAAEGSQSRRGIPEPQRDPRATGGSRSETREFEGAEQQDEALRQTASNAIVVCRGDQDNCMHQKPA